jgi:hypothetical protein
MIFFASSSFTNLQTIALGIARYANTTTKATKKAKQHHPSG